MFFLSWKKVNKVKVHTNTLHYLNPNKFFLVQMNQNPKTCCLEVRTRGTTIRMKNILSIAMLLLLQSHITLSIIYTTRRTRITYTKNFLYLRFLRIYLKKDTQNQHFCLLIECHDFACEEKMENYEEKVCCIRRQPWKYMKSRSITEKKFFFCPILNYFISYREFPA